jgi:chemotaxis protein histidine kinase CheA
VSKARILDSVVEELVHAVNSVCLSQQLSDRHNTVRDLFTRSAATAKNNLNLSGPADTRVIHEILEQAILGNKAAIRDCLNRLDELMKASFKSVAVSSEALQNAKDAYKGEAESEQNTNEWIEIVANFLMENKREEAERHVAEKLACSDEEAKSMVNKFEDYLEKSVPGIFDNRGNADTEEGNRVEPSTLIEGGNSNATSNGAFGQSSFSKFKNVKWFVLLQEKQYGPYDGKAMTQYVAQGRIGEDTLCWIEGMGQWMPLASVLEKLKSGM